MTQLRHQERTRLRMVSRMLKKVLSLPGMVHEVQMFFPKPVRL
jgi:hypothetical protein